ncbi:MAG: orotate phosphoribosyltransferase [Lachnospiraceae bacterium]|jgi:orotate phosphoribosyltransferase|nr:orotate phosphoribosyltransferase [Lachnospiraceae bacterium]
MTFEHNAIKINSHYNNTVQIKVVPGHFATNHSHITHYIDMTTLKSRQSMARAAAKSIASEYVASTVVDTIVCMDGTEVIGGYLAEELTESGIMSLNQHKAMYVVTPEFNSVGQMIFRDNLQPMIKGKHVLFLLASATTGRTIERSLECLSYYGGIVAGISAIFSASDTIAGQKVHTLFKTSDIPEYKTYPHNQCPFCQAGQKIEAIVNSYGYSKL